MMWVSLAFLVVFMVAVVAFRLGYTTGRNSMSDMIGTNGDLVRNHDREIILEQLNPAPVALPRESAASDVPLDADFERRELARQTFQQLKQLEKLKKDGMITTAEYSAKRTELLRTTDQ